MTLAEALLVVATGLGAGVAGLIFLVFRWGVVAAGITAAVLMF